MVRSTQATYLKVAGVAFFDLSTGEQQEIVDLAIGPEQYHAADRMVIDAFGNACICDPAANQIYLVTPAGKASILVDNTVLAPGVQLGLGAGTSGLALHPGGFLLAVNYSQGILVRFRSRTRRRPLPCRFRARSTAATVSRWVPMGR